MPFYEAADGTWLHYTDSRGRARPLLLIHGWCGRLEHWEPQARSLRRDHRVIRVDLRGHGRSEAPQTRYDREEFAHDVAKLMERSWSGTRWAG
jgi:3-oxoadipate enol-lactonase